MRFQGKSFAGINLRIAVKERPPSTGPRDAAVPPPRGEPCNRDRGAVARRETAAIACNSAWRFRSTPRFWWPGLCMIQPVTRIRRFSTAVTHNHSAAIHLRLACA